MPPVLAPFVSPAGSPSFPRRLHAVGLATAALTLAAALALPAAAASDLRTLSERSGFTKTGRYDEVVALCRAYARAWPTAVRCIAFGRTPENRPMLALVASRSGALDAKTARRRGIPVVLVQGGIHAGEIDGKDAGFLALREVLEGRAAPGALEKQVLVFVPVFNVDGHERFGRWNRPNQRGPEEMGWRTTAQNYNLNRDYVKADTPEMQAMLRLVDAWDPLAAVDLHVTDGAKFEHDVGIMVNPTKAGDDALRQAGTALRDGVIADLAKAGSLPTPYYPAFEVADDPASGFKEGISAPRLSHGYFHLRNRFGMLVETHSWKDYPHRVRVTRNIVVSVLEHVARHGRDWLRAAREADEQAARLAGRPVELAWEVTDKARIVEFRGYAYTRTPSDISGALMTRYDESKPEVWKIPLRDEVAPSLTVTAPRAGYLVPAGHAAAVGALLRLHGIAFRPLAAPLPGHAVEAFRADSVTWDAKSTEGHVRMKATGDWKPERRDVAAGALFVPVAQPKAKLAMSILEPRAPDSLLSWGLLATAFEQKEYMEDYVAEDVARAMLAADPALAAAFRKRLAEDEAFAKSPSARLEFFARRHASWDERYRLYPVLRTDIAPQ